MRYEVIWQPEALAQAERFAKDDSDGLRQCSPLSTASATIPVPTAPSALPTCLARYRVMYEISDQQVRVSVIHLGRVR
ncbi:MULTISPECIES: hypothetical protein [Streptomyces]|uniref:Type II toxin-antitoxin system RelE/ParE family toxin n=1 Tax=Streptomyces flaveolus TaxID=67297 RepID=A0ABV3ANV9_9ACTN|nr:MULTISPECIES: hypothetical protein [Streptomyces]KOG59436.1 hypothetical protein ADK77_39920 [Streptomyces antibioticus]